MVLKFDSFSNLFREVLSPTSETSATASANASHGIEVAVEFKSVEHPNEALDNDIPIQCPLLEPSIFNDGRIWKDRVSATIHKRSEVIKEDGGSKPRPTQTQTHRMILPSISAPEHNILKLLEECNAFAI
ncbi:hypothetical protein UlMin_032966 [Ulmus minor]